MLRPLKKYTFHESLFASPTPHGIDDNARRGDPHRLPRAGGGRVFGLLLGG
jgi:hypothetical protein